MPGSMGPRSSRRRACRRRLTALGLLASMGPPFVTAENLSLEGCAARRRVASMGPPFVTAENRANAARGVRCRLQWGRRSSRRRQNLRRAPSPRFNGAAVRHGGEPPTRGSSALRRSIDLRASMGPPFVTAENHPLWAHSRAAAPASMGPPFVTAENGPPVERRLMTSFNGAAVRHGGEHCSERWRPA